MVEKRVFEGVVHDWGHDGYNMEWVDYTYIDNRRWLEGCDKKKVRITIEVLDDD